MADETATADPAADSQEEAQRRAFEERQRRQQQQPQFSGFTLSAEASEKQRRKREEEAAAQQTKRREFDDIFLKTLAKIYGLPPQAESFKQDFVPILMACTVLKSSPEMMVGKFAGTQELPPIQIARNHVITQGGQMTPELAMQMAMLAAANPDMQRDGVEINGATEEDKLMLYAAAQLLGLKVINPPKIDNEQNQAQRIEACKQGWQNLHKWAQPGAAQPAPQPAPGPGPDDEEQSAQPRPAPGPAPRPGSNVPPVIPVSGATQPGDAGKQPAADNAAAEKMPDYDNLDDDRKNALRTFMKTAAGADLPDEQIDKELRTGWNSLNDGQRKALLDRAKAMQEHIKKQPEAAAPEPEPLTLSPPDAPVVPPAPTLKPVGQRKFDELLPAERHLLQEHGKKNGVKKDDVGKNWNKMREPGREKRYAEATKLDKSTAARAEEQRAAEIKKLNKRHEADIEKLKQDHDAALKLFKVAMAAADPETITDSPVLRPVESRKFNELLPAEQELLRAHAVQKGENPAAVSRKWNALKDDGRTKRFEEASAANKALAYDAAQQQKDAVKILNDAIARAKEKAPQAARKQPGAPNAEENGKAPSPLRAWEALDEADREEIREFVRREKSLRKAGDEYTEDEIKAPWGRMPNGEVQNKVLEDIKQANIKARAAAAAAPSPAAAPVDEAPDAGEKPVYKFLEERTFDELPAPAQEILNKHFAERKTKDGESVAAGSAKEEWNALDDAGKMARMEEGFRSHPELADAVMNALKAEMDALKAGLNGVESPVPAPAAGSPVVAPKPDEKPRRSFGQFVRDLLSSVWQAVRPIFVRTPKPTVEAAKVEPVAEAPPAPGVEEVSKKKFNDLLLQEKRLLLVEHATSEAEGELVAKWDALDEAGRARLFNTAFQNNPQLHADLKAEQDRKKASAPAQNLEPAPVEPVARKAVVAETPNLVKDAGERKWSELLDAEKEAAQIYFDGADPESGWNGSNAADRNTAIQIGIETKPELAAKIESARKAENERLVAATTPPPSNTDRVKQQDAVIATTPPPSNAARVEQKANLAPVAATPAVADKELEQEVPKDDAALEGALKARGLTRDALLAMPPDQRKGILAEIKAEQEKDKAPVVEARRKEPARATPSESMTVAFNNISVDNIHELPPSNDARRVIQNQSLPKSIDKENLLQAYQQIRAKVVRQQASNPGFRVTRAFLENAADENHLKELLGHKGLRPEETNAILACLKVEGVTVQKSAHAQVHAANDWQTRLASHYKPEM